MQRLQMRLLRQFWGPWASSHLQQGCAWQACRFSISVGEPEAPKPVGTPKKIS